MFVATIHSILFLFQFIPYKNYFWQILSAVFYFGL
jgi:hypothetical protein